MKKFTFFEYSNTSGEVFRMPFNTKEDQKKAWLKMWRYYNSKSRMHPIYEQLDIYDENSYYWDDYQKANKKDIPSIRKLLDNMWGNSGLFSFYGKKISINK